MSKYPELIEVMSLWIKEDKNGDLFFTGNFNCADVVIFKNRHKDQPNHPDYRMYIKKRTDREKSNRPPPPQKDDGIPF